MESEKKVVLCVGLVCIDIIQVCGRYPKEDSDQRCLESRWQRGGNASNNCTVFSQLGTECEFLGTMSDGIFTEYAKEDFKKDNICIDHCVFHNGCEFPLSTVLINAANGSRTIIHSNKNLPELTLENFKALDLSKYRWIHFEGRNVTEAITMLEHVKDWNCRNRPVRTSVEVEKDKPDMNKFLPFADFVFVGKDYAVRKGCKNMKEAVIHFYKLAKPEATVICPWGEQGAMSYSKHDGFAETCAYPPKKVVDTLGAGDTFVAATISHLLNGFNVKQSIEFGCKVAGIKVGMPGYRGIKQVLNGVL